MVGQEFMHACIRYSTVCSPNTAADSGVILYHMVCLIAYKNILLLIIIYIPCTNIPRVDLCAIDTLDL